MKAIKPIREGEEIFNDYGEIPRADLLRRYGYVTDNYTPFDVIELSLKDICQVAGLTDCNVESQPRVCRPCCHDTMAPMHDQYTNLTFSCNCWKSMTSWTTDI